MFCGRESQTGFKRHEIFIFNWNLPFICPASFFMCVLCLPFIISSEFIFKFILHVCNPNYIFKMQNLKKNIPKQWLHFALHSVECLYILPLRKFLAYLLHNSLSLHSSIFLFFYFLFVTTTLSKYVQSSEDFWGVHLEKRSHGNVLGDVHGDCRHVSSTGGESKADRQTKTELKSLKPIWLLTQMMELHQTYLTLTEYRICVMMKYECDDMLTRHMLWLWWELQ